MAPMTCFFADLGWGECDGPIDRAHWIPKQRIRREFRHGGTRHRYDLKRGDTLGPMVRALRSHEEPLRKPCGDEYGLRLEPVDLAQIVWDERAWVYGCRRHHGQLDNKREFMRRDQLPDGVEAFAKEYGLAWSLDLDYGPKEEPDGGNRRHAAA